MLFQLWEWESRRFCIFMRRRLFPTRLVGGGGGGGYNHLRNYWCDLYAVTGPAGDVNSGRPYAIAATLALVMSLFFFWVTVTALFVEFTVMCWIVWVAGGVSSGAGMFIFTPALM